METNLSLNGGDLKVPLIGSREAEQDEESGWATGASGSNGVGGGTSNKHSLGFGALVFLIYYNIGVPFGDEEVREDLGI